MPRSAKVSPAGRFRRFKNEDPVPLIGGPSPFYYFALAMRSGRLTWVKPWCPLRGETLSLGVQIRKNP
jgi:hypothetical protein